MQTIIALGFFGDRNKTIFEALTNRFRVIVFKDSQFVPQNGYKCEFAEDLAKEQSPFPIESLVWQSLEFVRYTEERLKEWGFEDSKLTESEYKLFHPFILEAVHRRFILRNLAKSIKIDYIISNADYQARCRSILLEARELGIPTFAFEHGYFVCYPSAKIYDPEILTATPYASETVNFDTLLELESVKNYHGYGEGGYYPPELVVLGTPCDTSRMILPGKDDAAKILGVDAKKRSVVVLCDWIEMRTPASVFRWQDDDFECYDEIINSFAKWPKRDEYNLIFKMHPAFSFGEVADDVTAFLKEMAKRAGIKEITVTANNLDACFALAEIVVSIGISSALWEAFLQKIPMALFPLRFDAQWGHSIEELMENNILYDNNVMVPVMQGQDIWKYVESMEIDTNRSFYLAQHGAVTAKFNLKSASATDKSSRICDWLRDRMVNSARKGNISVV